MILLVGFFQQMNKEDLPLWLKEATNLTKKDSSEIKETSIEIKEKIQEIPSRKNTWLETVYLKVWKKDQKNGLSIKELLTRFVEPESPRWFFIKAKNFKNFTVRFKCWQGIREELYEQIRKTNFNVYAYHNAAVLSFFLEEDEFALKILNKLIEKTPSETLLLTMAYFYIEKGRLNDAACILYNNLNESDHNTHTIYLSMRLLTKIMDLPKKEQGFFEKWFFKQPKLNENLKEIREKVMPSLCNLKPNNHLYKLWALHWKWLNEENHKFLTQEECVKITKSFLKNMIDENNESGIEWSSIFNILIGILMVSG